VVDNNVFTKRSTTLLHDKSRTSRQQRFVHTQGKHVAIIVSRPGFSITPFFRPILEGYHELNLQIHIFQVTEQSGLVLENADERSNPDLETRWAHPDY
jgi:hypothetical protein